MFGVDVTFDAGGMRASDDQHAAVSAACDRLGEALARHGIGPEMLGAVPAAAGFHAAVSRELARQSADVAAEARRRMELAGRAARTAGLGAGLVTETTAAARAVAPPGGSG